MMDTTEKHLPQLYCQACSQAVTLHFCPRCGESRPQRLHSKTTLKKLAGAVLNVDQRWPKTIRLLLTDPGLLIQNYFQGIRRQYANPILMLLLFGSAFLLLHHWRPLVPDGEIQGSQQMFDDIMTLALQYTNYLMILLAYPVAAASGWLWRGTTVAERYVALLYANVLNYMVSLGLYLAGAFSDNRDLMLSLSILSMILVFSYFYVSVRRRFWAGLRLACWQILLQQAIVMLLGTVMALMFLFVQQLQDYQQLLTPYTHW